MIHHRLVTLSTRRRISRRALLSDLGAAGLGLAILGACGGSSDDAAVGDADAPTGLRLQHVPLGFVSAFVLLRGAEAAVVDTGTDGSAMDIGDGLLALGADWSDVAHVVLTHNHGDHIGGLAGVVDATSGVTVYAGEADLSSIRTSAPTVAVGDGDEVLGLGVLATPGHTPGSISLFDTESGILLAGDALTGTDGELDVANPQFTADPAQALESIAKLAALRPAVVGFGHSGPPITTDVATQLDALVAGN